MKTIKAVIIEAGHGLSNAYPKWMQIKDNGSSSGDHIEYEITSDLARRVCDMLRPKEELREAVVQGTGFATRARYSDKVVFANQVVHNNGFLPADCIFVSIHCNSNTGTPGTGIEVYPGKLYDSEKLADSMLDSLCTYSKLKNRGKKYANHYHLNVDAISILAEVGFINNPTDQEWLDNRDRVATAIAHGILEYIRNN